MENQIQIPKSFPERIVWARQEFIHNSENSQLDDNGLIWCQNREDKNWYSIAGNYSQYSPQEKRIKQFEREKRQEEYQKSVEQAAKEHYNFVYYQSEIRAKIFERDNHSCQLCGKFGTSKLHIHHILKRTEGGGDTLDNLLTVCQSCHSAADNKLYNPSWE